MFPSPAQVGKPAISGYETGTTNQTLNCTSCGGSPAPQIHWFMNGKLAIIENGTLTFQNGNCTIGSIYLEGVSDGDMVTCVARNGFASNRASDSTKISIPKICKLTEGKTGMLNFFHRCYFQSDVILSQRMIIVSFSKSADQRKTVGSGVSPRPDKVTPANN